MPKIIEVEKCAYIDPANFIDHTSISCNLLIGTSVSGSIFTNLELPFKVSSQIILRNGHEFKSFVKGCSQVFLELIKPAHQRQAIEVQIDGALKLTTSVGADYIVTLSDGQASFNWSSASIHTEIFKTVCHNFVLSKAYFQPDVANVLHKWLFEADTDSLPTLKGNLTKFSQTVHAEEVAAFVISHRASLPKPVQFRFMSLFIKSNSAMLREMIELYYNLH